MFRKTPKANAFKLAQDAFDEGFRQGQMAKFEADVEPEIKRAYQAGAEEAQFVQQEKCRIAINKLKAEHKKALTKAHVDGWQQGYLECFDDSRLRDDGIPRCRIGRITAH